MATCDYDLAVDVKLAERWRMGRRRERPLAVQTLRQLTPQRALRLSNNRRCSGRTGTMMVWRCIPAVVCAPRSQRSVAVTRGYKSLGPRVVCVFRRSTRGTQVACGRVDTPQHNHYHHNHQTTTPARHDMLLVVPGVCVCGGSGQSQ